MSVSARHPLDFYSTPAWMTRALLRRLTFRPSYVLEPCAGQGAIADVLRQQPNVLHVETNDLDPSTPCDSHEDASRPEYWLSLTQRTHNRPDVAITNLPFNQADAIVPLAVQSVRLFATILRLSWLEPTNGRQEFLRCAPPDKLIVLPRHDFKGQGATDSVTSAWFLWGYVGVGRPIDVVTKAERDELIAQQRQG